MILLKYLTSLLLTLFLFAEAAFASTDIRPCYLEFERTNVSEGKPGQVISMYGRWGGRQGEKLPAINRAKLVELEVIYWSDTKLIVRIPPTIQSGMHKIGVYCSDPRKGATYASNWRFFNISGPVRPERLDDEPSEMKADQKETALQNNAGIGDPLTAYEKRNSIIWIFLTVIISAGLLYYLRQKPK